MRRCEHRGRTDTDGQDKKGRIEKRRYEISAENPNRTTSDSQSRALATDAQTTHTNTDAGATTAEAAKAIIRVAIVRVRSDGLRRWGRLFRSALALRGGTRGGWRWCIARRGSDIGFRVVIDIRIAVGVAR